MRRPEECLVKREKGLIRALNAPAVRGHQRMNPKRRMKTNITVAAPTIGRPTLGARSQRWSSWAFEKKKTFADAVRWGVAAGTASAALPGMNFATLEQTKETYKKVEVREAR